tara:strand:+ start:221 stop:490 length:270 start_codon:yes stop_codon:yes gene_type:complete
MLFSGCQEIRKIFGFDNNSGVCVREYNHPPDTFDCYNYYTQYECLDDIEDQLCGNRDCDWYEDWSCKDYCESIEGNYWEGNSCYKLDED